MTDATDRPWGGARPTRRALIIAGVAVAGVSGPACAQSPAALTPAAFGARAGQNATAALTELFQAAVRADRPVDFSQAATYLIDPIRLPEGLRIVGRGAELRAAPTTPRGATLVTVGRNARIERLALSLSGAEKRIRIAEIAAGCDIGQLRIAADRQGDAGGVVCAGQDVHIGAFESRFIDRPLHVMAQPGAPATGFRLGRFSAESYVRALRLDYLDDFQIGPIACAGRSAAAGKRPGHNGILIVGCQKGRFEDCVIADAGEHAVRIGGAERKTTDIAFADVTALRSGGCAFKINPNVRRLAAERISIGTLHGQDGGDPLGGNSDLLRVTHARAMSVQRLEASVRTRRYSCWTGMKLNDVDGLHIGSVDIQGARHGLFLIDEFSDGDPHGVFNVRIDALKGHSGGSAVMNLDISSPDYAIGDIRLHGLEITGEAEFLCRSTDDRPIRTTGPISFQGRLDGAIGGRVSGLPAGDPRMTVDLTVNGARYAGHPSGLQARLARVPA